MLNYQRVADAKSRTLLRFRCRFMQECLKMLGVTWLPISSVF